MFLLGGEEHVDGRNDEARCNSLNSLAELQAIFHANVSTALLVDSWARHNGNQPCCWSFQEKWPVGCTDWLQLLSLL